MNLAPHFTLAELTRSAKAAELGLDNTPDAATIDRLRLTAAMLERIRDKLGAAVVVTSGFRCIEVNRAVGGVTSSDHVAGCAADILVPGFGEPYQVAKALAPHISVLGIGQLIYEAFGRSRWVHVSTRTPSKPSNRVITMSGAGTQLGIQQV